MELIKIRKKIDKIDKKMAILFSKRMDEVSKVKKIKKEKNIQILDLKREENIITNNLKFVNSLYSNQYINFINNILNISKEYQV